MTAAPLWISALDLGKVEDYTAHAIIEIIPQSLPFGAAKRNVAPGPIYEVRHLERYQPPSYPELVRRVVAMHRRAELYGRSVLTLDATGVGLAVTDLFLDAKDPGWCRIDPVIITSGQHAHGRKGFRFVPKHELAMTMQVVLQQQRLRIARGLKEAETARKELLAFRIKYSEKGNVSYAAWREKDHDDIVLALAIGIWLAESDPSVWKPHVFHPGTVPSGYRARPGA